MIIAPEVVRRVFRACRLVHVCFAAFQIPHYLLSVSLSLWPLTSLSPAASHKLHRLPSPVAHLVDKDFDVPKTVSFFFLHLNDLSFAATLPLLSRGLHMRGNFTLCSLPGWGAEAHCI